MQNRSLYMIINKVPYTISRFRNIAKQSMSYLLASIGAYKLYGQDLLRFADVVGSCLRKSRSIWLFLAIARRTFGAFDARDEHLLWEGRVWRGAKQMAAFWCFCKESTSLHVTTGTDIYSGFLLVLYNNITSFFNIIIFFLYFTSIILTIYT